MVAKNINNEEIRFENVYEFIKYTESNIKVSDNEDIRYELIDGYLYMMSSPTVYHQEICGYINWVLRDYLKDKKCKVFESLNLYLFDESKYSSLFNTSFDNPFDISSIEKHCKNLFEPDIMVICEKNKIFENGIYGSPDFIIEVVSKSTSRVDYIYKLHEYMRFGVKEYWIVDYLSGSVTVYINKSDINNNIVNYHFYEYAFSDKIRVNLFHDLYIDFDELNNSLSNITIK